ncbi:fumarylacetoacetate hydrolase family protein [Bdellovibrio sp.]|uniref:fumarylacetoacetate hydrolase family protein n=1 Tax=Bdellovibrio sp. TaxID=28201 RepID=UPI0039E29469
MIQNVWAVGRNYAEHAKELGNEVPTEPMIFLKAGSTTTLAAKEIHLPAWIQEVHHEVELALRFDDNLQIEEACIALDLTERAKQNQLKAKGHPWTLAKSFTESCPLSPFFPVSDLEELKKLDLILKINGEVRQKGNTSQMIFSLEKLIDYVRHHFPVVPGDLLLTGTPSGVGPIQRGDHLEAEIQGKMKHSWKVS